MVIQIQPSLVWTQLPFGAHLPVAIIQKREAVLQQLGRQVRQRRGSGSGGGLRGGRAPHTAAALATVFACCSLEQAGSSNSRGRMQARVGR